MNWKKNEWFRGLAWLQAKEDACPETSPHLFQQKTEDREQVFEVERKEMNSEKFISSKKTTKIALYFLRFQSKTNRKEQLRRSFELKSIIIKLVSSPHPFRLFRQLILTKT